VTGRHLEAAESSPRPQRKATGAGASEPLAGLISNWRK